MIFACAALGLVGVVRLVRLQGPERRVFAGALLGSALLVVLAGGPVSDAIFDRGGTAGLVDVAWEPDADHFLPFRQAGSALVTVGVIPLVAIGALAAYRRRSWGLGFLAAAGACGLLEAQLLQSQISSCMTIAFYWLTHAVAMHQPRWSGAWGCDRRCNAGRPRAPIRLAMRAVVGSPCSLLPTGLPRAVCWQFTSR